MVMYNIHMKNTPLITCDRIVLDVPFCQLSLIVNEHILDCIIDHLFFFRSGTCLMSTYFWTLFHRFSYDFGTLLASF